MRKAINFSAILLLVLLVTTGLMEKGETQPQPQKCEWECKHLPNFRCWLGEAGKNLCHDMCKNEGASHGVCISDAATNSHRCLCRKPGCS